MNPLPAQGDGEGAIGRQVLALPATLEKAVADAAEAWRRDGKVRRLWARDASLWTGSDEAKWLGWLDSLAESRAQADDLARFGAGVARERLSHILLIGMGGSSLGPEVIGETFRRQQDGPQFLVLDSTDPAQIRSFERHIDPARTLFIVSSKSGTTIEPNILMQYFFARAAAALGKGKAGARFIAITDRGSALEEEARQQGFRHIFYGRANIGGRYSVLSIFGMVPAAVLGVDLPRFLGAAERMVRACDANVPPEANPGVMLGLVLGEAASAGRDKATMLASPGLHDLGAWLEQLLAESTGKNGRGIVPVDDEPLASPERYGSDRLFVDLRLAAERDSGHDQRVAALARAGHPVVRIAVPDAYALGQEFFRWEIATAVACAIIGVNPFDQPDVEASKVKTRALTSAYEKAGRLPEEKPFFTERKIALFADAKNRAALETAAPEKTLAGFLRAHLARAGNGDYVAFLAYIERSEKHSAALRALRAAIRDKTRAATCVGFGPRFLHSTGQAYKGGPSSGVFLQITWDAPDLSVPGAKYGFAAVEAAQARGDLDVLAERGRRCLRVHLGADADAGLAALAEAIGQSPG